MNTINIIIIGMFSVLMVISLWVVFKNGLGKQSKDGKIKAGYFEDENGDKSSTRLTSFLMQFFFYIINIMVFSGIMDDKEIISNMQFVFIFLIFDALMLVAIFVPKQLGKLSEIKEVIELAKTEKKEEIKP
jgi:Na+-transporting methylmalonyl-CoA/oxaloacetate decarboxylase gamma subunit